MIKSTYQTACAGHMHGYVVYISMHANTDGYNVGWSCSDFEDWIEHIGKNEED